MRTHILFIFICLLYPSFINAQINHTSTFPNIQDKKGTLIAINEMHDVTTNFLVYTDILKNINAQLHPGDSINLFMEIPYSCAVMLNDFLTDKSKEAQIRKIMTTSYPPASFIDTIRALNMPVKIFGCDFEYDKAYKRNRTLVYLLEKLHTDWAPSGTDLKALETYIQLVKEFQINKNHTHDLQTWLRNNQTSAPTNIQSEINQVLFSLEARQSLSAGRDKDIYERALQAINMHYYDAGRFNILIHGAAHINPVFRKSLFNFFRNNTQSPFINKCFLIGNVYLDCKTNSGIFKNESISSFSFYPIPSDDAAVIDYFRKKNLVNHSVYFMLPPTDLSFPGVTNNELLGIYLHNRIAD